MLQVPSRFEMILVVKRTKYDFADQGFGGTKRGTEMPAATGVYIGQGSVEQIGLEVMNAQDQADPDLELYLSRYLRLSGKDLEN